MLDSLANVKSRLGISTDADDTFLTNQIALISEVIERYCRRRFEATDWVQNFYREDILNTNRLELFHFPTISLTSVIIDDTALDSTKFRMHKPTSILLRTMYSPPLLGDEIEVKYRAGYEAGQMPKPILEVLDALVNERYNKKKSGVDLNFGSDVQRVSIPGAISIDFDYSLANNERKSAYGTIIGNYANVLDDWRSERSVVGSGEIEYVQEDI